MESLIDIDPTNKKHHRVKENNFLKFVDCNRENRNLLLGKSVTTVYSRPKSGTAQSKAGLRSIKGWLVSEWYGFLLRSFFTQVAPIFNYKFSCVKKFNCPMVYSEIPLGRDSFLCGDRSVGN